MDSEILARETVYDGWTRVERIRLKMPDGAELERHIENHGQAVSVLPYDPDRKMALLVTLPRAPVLDALEPELLEAVAGAMEGENPEACARREALEEVGVVLGDLQPVGFVWSMPALSTERIHLFLGAFQASDRIAAGGGALGEHENIVVHEVPLRDLAQMATRGHLQDMKTLVLVQALQIAQPELFSN